MPSFPVPPKPWLEACDVEEARQLGHQSGPQLKRLPCLVLDSSKDGFRLRRGQVVEIALDEDPLTSLRCSAESSYAYG